MESVVPLKKEFYSPLSAELSFMRMRQSLLHRSLAFEVASLCPEKFIQPLFVCQGRKEKKAIFGLTGVYQDTPESLLKQIEADIKVGIRHFLLFVVPEEKKEVGFQAAFACEQIAAIKKHFGKEILLFIDVCLCSYTTSGQCGILTPDHQRLDHQKTVDQLVQFAVDFAQSGADGVAPSDMMDDRIRCMRLALRQNQLDSTLIMSYSAKFDSRFYGPFRAAAESAPKGAMQERSSYQISPRTPSEAYWCSLNDAQAGADILMVKPMMPYLDVLHFLTEKISKPFAAYEVSGEFASRELLSQNGMMSRAHGHIESWTAGFRAGASMLITYGARCLTEFKKAIL
jgi:porphobilinogen synthase